MTTSSPTQRGYLVYVSLLLVGLFSFLIIAILIVSPLAAFAASASSPHSSGSNDLSSEEETYLWKVKAIADPCMAAMNGVSDAVSGKGGYSSLSGIDYVNGIQGMISSWQQECSRLRQITPPKRFWQYHTYLLDYLYHVDQAAIAWRNGNIDAFVQAFDVDSHDAVAQADAELARMDQEIGASRTVDSNPSAVTDL